MQLDGSGLAQWEAMQQERGQKESVCSAEDSRLYIVDLAAVSYV